MKNLEQQFSEDLLITQSSNSVRECSDPIPSDLLIDIFSRVTAKSIARFRCVSKYWGSILGRPDFTELFLTKSWTRPRILFAIQVNNEFFVYSSPQPQNPVKRCSLVATRYNYFPKYFPSEICPPLSGLVFLHETGRTVRVICNPVTGESITLRMPTMKRRELIEERCYFGYDPISKQFKVLCLTCACYVRPAPNTHWVLTLGNENCLWRSTMECKPHDAFGNGICINGVLYYKAGFKRSFMIACFDLRFEKFSFIEVDREMIEFDQKLTNYKGKLCAHRFIRGSNQDELELWVLEDIAGEHKWSKSICVLPGLCYDEMPNRFCIVGVTDVGEIVFSRSFQTNPTFYLFYYNIESNTCTRVEIQGLEEFVRRPKHVFLDYAENMTLNYASVFKAS
ncbi:hypothetical protein EUTSA_v10012153mg [Eutrema salsugineum]|uniref:F-box domain-containing protein n=1 Tax=Eutrema salsugineum TaxID=72664 RepID=V4JXB3_EUTSA|nr:putative F-box protein At1g53360 [Eutrema salsugineum]ESQ30085.1 hypothetical protein EUTSA_v10012153mg [Eutrema salsugineum]